MHFISTGVGGTGNPHRYFPFMSSVGLIFKLWNISFPCSTCTKLCILNEMIFNLPHYCSDCQSLKLFYGVICPRKWVLWLLWPGPSAVSLSDFPSLIICWAVVLGWEGIVAAPSTASSSPPSRTSKLLPSSHSQIFLSQYLACGRIWQIFAESTRFFF